MAELNEHFNGVCLTYMFASIDWHRFNEEREKKAEKKMDNVFFS